MNPHLAEISAAAVPGAHAVFIMDQAGWRTTGKLNLPEDISPSCRCRDGHRN